MSKKTVYILWTSGWDSTYRMVELSKMEVAVQPIYITGMGRPSEQNEIEAQKHILAALAQKKETVAELLPVKFIEASDLPHHEEISNAYAEIKKTVALGIQYETLAQCASLYPGIEIGSEGGEACNLRMTEAILAHGGLIERDGTYMIDPDNADEAGKNAFGYFTFPIIYTPESKMYKNIKEWGYEDVMSKIWFCHDPIENRPCGLCRACEVKMQNDMEWLLPKDAQKRYRRQERLIKICGKRFAKAFCNRLYR